MTKFNNNKINYKFWHSPIVLIFLFCILVLFGYKIIDLIKKQIETAHKKELVLNQIDSLQKRQTSLSSDILKLGTDEGKEEIIREKYQVAKDGEKVVVIVDDSKSSSGPESGKIDHSFWGWIKRTFKF
jgi:cell division protein FtsB